ncbi:MAG: hypothetical protein AB7J32_15445 [Pseudonocardia sp.]
MTYSFHTAGQQGKLVIDPGLSWAIRGTHRTVRFRFEAHYHPYTDELIERLTTDGLAALLDPNHHADLARRLDPGFYRPGPYLLGDFPRQEIDVSDEGPYAGYNWELFFHAPLAVAVHLSKNQRFAQARRWFHLIFDPTTDERARRDLEKGACAVDAGGNLRFFATTVDGAVLEARRPLDGVWQPRFGNVEASSTGPPSAATSIACATDRSNNVHVCVTTADGGIFHTIRFANGSWQPFFGNVKSQTGDPGPATAIACTTDTDNNVHVCVTTADGGIFHTIRFANGSWQPFFGNVKSQTGDPGPATAIACTTDTDNNVHVCVTTADGGIFHTIRFANGSWQPFFGNVKSRTSDPGPATAIACTTDTDNNVHVCPATADGSAWHAARRSDGTWSGAFSEITAAAATDPGDVGSIACTNHDGDLHLVVTTADDIAWEATLPAGSTWDGFTRAGEVDGSWRFWKFLRFRTEASPRFVDDLLAQLADLDDGSARERMTQAVQAWRDKPFQPHVIARTRYLAYQMSVVMKYLDNLIAWGDSLFRQDTVETINEATQLYVLAANLLGPRPQRVPPRTRHRSLTYAQLKEAGVDEFGNALVELENEFPFNTVPSAGGAGTGDGPASAFGIVSSLYFCIPPNQTLLAYWDTVADRLFKIRHCMNIEGVVRQLALFDPPIDPGALVKAAAAGLDIAAVAAGLNQPVSTVRGPLLLAKAQELCAEVKALGAAVLAAVEKGEAEHLAALRQRHESELATLGREVRFLQWKEAEAATDALLASRTTVFERYRHYKRILGASDPDIDAQRVVTLVRSELTEATFDAAYTALVEAHTVELGREDYRKETTVGGPAEFAAGVVTGLFGGKLGETLPLNKNEDAELNIFLPASDTAATIATALDILAPVLALIPQFDAHGTPLGVGVAAGFGGVQLSKGAKYGSDGAKWIADAFRASADRASRLAGYYRRAEDYVLQANLATSELEQYGRQIVSSLLREQIVRREYENHVRQTELNTETEEFLRDKFTTEALYTWMHGELSALHHEFYTLAFDVARRAEQTLKHELMRPEFDAQDFVRFGHWDGGHRGLLAGERLGLDLKRLELAHLEHDRREYELTTRVSLARLDPVALLRLRATGACEIDVPEWLYDLESPGQFMRRIKTVAVSIPCVVGDYTGVHAKLSLVRSSLRTSALLGEGYARTGGDDGRFRDYAGAIQSVVTSSGREDSGLFEVNLRDERRLPFEGAGAISTWRLELPAAVPLFDVDTISDVVLHVRYTAREAGHLREPAVTALTEEVLAAPAGLLQLFSLPHDFAREWAAFGGAADDASRTLTLTVTRDHFPYWLDRTGMDDALSASFFVVDRERSTLVVAPAAVPLVGTASDGWTLEVDETTAAPVFAFLKKHRAAQVSMALAYAAAG